MWLASWLDINSVAGVDGSSQERLNPVILSHAEMSMPCEEPLEFGPPSFRRDACFSDRASR
jgi:hypothetical protein